MLTIEYANEMICGEPGPNLYFFGNRDDFFKLSCLLHPLATSNDIRIDLPCIANEIPSILSMKSIKNGAILNKYDIENNTILMHLDCEYWIDILSNCFLISMRKGRVYIDFETQKLIADANLIIDSQKDIT